MEQGGARLLSSVSLASSPGVSVSTSLPGGGGDAERRGGGGGGGGTAGCKEECSPLIEPGCVEARVSLESWWSDSERVGALLGLRGFLVLPPEGFLAMPPSASELREFELLRGRVSSGLLRGCGASGGFLALPPARELRGLGLLRGGSGSEGFLALPPELWEIEPLGSGGGAAIFRPQEHRGEWSMAVQSLACAERSDRFRPNLHKV